MNSTEAMLIDTDEAVPLKLDKPSLGQVFKKRFGYSRTMGANMKKAGVKTVVEYKKLRKERKKLASAARRAKHNKSLANRKAPKSKFIKATTSKDKGKR